MDNIVYFPRQRGQEAAQCVVSCHDRLSYRREPQLTFAGGKVIYELLENGTMHCPLAVMGAPPFSSWWLNTHTKHFTVNGALANFFGGVFLEASEVCGGPVGDLSLGKHTHPSNSCQNGGTEISVAILPRTILFRAWQYEGSY